MTPIESAADEGKRRREVQIVAILLLVYIVIRVALLPANPWTSQGMSHDAAYLAIVAKNLLAGKGFVLDALWLVFLQPDHLPMPFHNANPLYPVTIALVSRLTGCDVIRSGFLISALSGAGVVLALTIIVNRFVKAPLRAAGIAFAVALFPVVWDLSWENVTDEFSLMFLLCALALLLCAEGAGAVAAAGVLFGLAWLARSMAISALPAIAVWMLLRSGWRRGAVRVLLLGACAFVVGVPWFIHNLHTWGDPFRSDDKYLASVTFYYRQIDGTAARAWFSPEKPLPLGVLVREHPVVIADNWAHSLKPFFVNLAVGIAGASYIKLLTVVLLTAGVLLCRWRTLLNREGAAFGVYLLTVTALMSGMGNLMEPRYFLPGYALFAAWLFSVLSNLRWREGLLARALLTLAAIYIIFAMLPSAIRTAEAFRRPDTEEKVPLMRAANTVNQTISHGAPVVVGFHPYLYSLYTGAEALAIPQSDDQYLLAYMRKYHACCIVLTNQELAFWRPQWRTALPPHIFPIRSIEGYNVYGVAP